MAAESVRTRQARRHTLDTALDRANTGVLLDHKHDTKSAIATYTEACAFFDKSISIAKSKDEDCNKLEFMKNVYTKRINYLNSSREIRRESPPVIMTAKRFQRLAVPSQSTPTEGDFSIVQAAVPDWLNDVKRPVRPVPRPT